MHTAQTRLSTYTEIRDRVRTNSIRMNEIPLEHTVSFPIPTKKWGGMPGYAFFASPNTRKPNEPSEQGAPDRWWVIDALSGKTIVYALFRAVPFDAESKWTSVQLPLVGVTVAEVQQRQKELDSLMDELAPKFFNDEDVTVDKRRELLNVLTENISAPVMEQYRSI